MIQTTDNISGTVNHMTVTSHTEAQVKISPRLQGELQVKIDESIDKGYTTTYVKDFNGIDIGVQPRSHS